jgi:hypothetical protein
MNNIIRTSKGLVNHSSISFKLLRKRKSNSTRHLTETVELRLRYCKIFFEYCRESFARNRDALNGVVRISYHVTMVFDAWLTWLPLGGKLQKQSYRCWYEEPVKWSTPLPRSLAVATKEELRMGHFPNSSSQFKRYVSEVLDDCLMKTQIFEKKIHWMCRIFWDNWICKHFDIYFWAAQLSHHHPSPVWTKPQTFA